MSNPLKQYHHLLLLSQLYCAKNLFKKTKNMTKICCSSGVIVLKTSPNNGTNKTLWREGMMLLSSNTRFGVMNPNNWNGIQLKIWIQNHNSLRTLKGFYTQQIHFIRLLASLWNYMMPNHFEINPYWYLLLTVVDFNWLLMMMARDSRERICIIFQLSSRIEIK